MARNPKPIRKERKRLQAAARRGELTGPVPTYDQLARIRETKRAWRQARQQIVTAWNRAQTAFRPIVSAILEQLRRPPSTGRPLPSPAGGRTRLSTGTTAGRTRTSRAAAPLARRAFEEKSSTTLQDASGHPSGIRFGQPWQALSQTKGMH